MLINTVSVVFDTDLTNPGTCWGIKIPGVPRCVKDYEVEVFSDGAWKKVAEARENFMRKRIHTFEKMNAEKIRVNVLATWGDPSARIMEVRAALEKDADIWFDEEKIDPALRNREYFLDMRYKGQNHEIRVPITMDQLSSAQTLRAAYIKAYEQLYSFSSDDASRRAAMSDTPEPRWVPTRGARVSISVKSPQLSGP